MDKYEATKTLTGKLAEHFGTLVVSDEVYKDLLVKKAQHVYVIGNPIDVGLYREGSQISYTKRDANNKCIESKKLEDVITKFIPVGTNYLFTSPKVMMNENRMVFNVTPYLIIGDKELEAVKKLFYKTYDPNIREAVSSLGIKDFFELYHAYRYNNERFQSLFCNNFENFKSEILEFVQSLHYDSSNETRLDAFEAKFKIEKLNSRLKEFGVKFVLPTTQQFNWIKKHELDLLVDLLNNHIPPIDKDPLNVEFLKFVFEIPYEDQNLDMNRYMFQNFGKFLNINLIVLKEYSNGRYFKDYFDLLDGNKQREIVQFVKQSRVQNQDYNHYLWMRGSKDIRLDYLKLYREDAEGFINYFAERRVEEKKVILNDIMDGDFTNEKVIDWLNENEEDLIREVGFNG